MELWRIMRHWRLEYDAENSALRHRNKLHFKIYYNRKHSFEVSVCFCSLQEFENTEGQADLSTLASPSSQNDPEVYILPLTEVSLPVSKQPSKSCKNLYGFWSLFIYDSQKEMLWMTVLFHVLKMQCSASDMEWVLVQGGDHEEACF